MWEFDQKEGWVPTNWCFGTVVLEKTLENPLDSKEIKPVNPTQNQPWIFIGRTHAKAEAPIHWPPDAKSWLTGKDPDAGKDWRQEEKGTTEMRWLNGITKSMDMSFSKLQMVKDWDLACCSPGSCKESDMYWVTEQQKQQIVFLLCNFSAYIILTLIIMKMWSLTLI